MKKVLVFLLVIVAMFSLCLVASAEEVAPIEEEFSFVQWLKDNITIERVTTGISVVISTILSVVVAKITKALGLSKDVNTKHIVSTVESAVNEKVGEGLKQVVEPIKIEYQKVINEVHTLVKGMALLQDNTPQSKLAMYDLIEKTGVVETEIIEQCKADVQEQIIVEEQKKEEKKEALKDIVNATPID